MKKHKDAVRKVEEALVHCHRRPVEIEPGPFWQKGLMARVREERRYGSSVAGNDFVLNNTVWRFAMAAGLAVLLLTAYVMKSDTSAQYQLADLFQDDSAGMDLARSFGVL